jgi:[ribosomal protein S5]-alanine N-acetyltransferase
MSNPSVRIVHLSPEALAALAARELAVAEALSPVPLTPWVVTDDAVVGTWQRRAVQVVDVPEDVEWVTGVIWSEDVGSVVGQAGFHGAPDAAGMVEVGYQVDPAYRRQGFARAALLPLLPRARAEPEVRTLRATVSPENSASLALIAQLPFVEVGEQWDEEDGLETIFELDVS